MRTLIFVCLSLVAANAAGQEYPEHPTDFDTIDPERELYRLGSFNGVWEGFFEVNYDPVGFYRKSPGGQKMRLVINGSSVMVEVYEDNKPVRLAVENYIYAVEGTAMINTVNRNDGFVQNFSIFLAHVERDRMEGYVSLNVHNYLYVNTSPWRIFPAYGRLTVTRQ
ncbi:MAG TPA: hypothetical protein VLB07_08255 [Woeseiaceae bacterium]|nr:hypothetical protein [Woeseiaceae bacterium]